MIKLDTLLSESLNDKVKGVIQQVSGKLKNVSNGPHIQLSPYETRYKGSRTWTRGDGARSKDWNEIVPTHFGKFGFSSEKTAINFLWKNIEELPGAKKIQVKGEFGSSPWYPAVSWKGVVFKKGDFSIYFGTTSRLRNSSVWTSKERE